MLQIFFVLLYYSENVHVDSNDYFKSYSYLKYGFKKNAKIYFNINLRYSKMVFGLATQEELDEIASKKDKIEYCEGTHQLSKIQFLVTGKTNFTNQTSKKGFLTPYSFGCNTSYDFYLYLEYKNIQSHSDYRIQNAIIYTVIFTIFYLILEICFHLYCKRMDFGFFIFLEAYFVLTFIYFLLTSIFLILMHTDEFYDEISSSSIVYLFSSIINVCTFFVLNMIYMYLSNIVSLIDSPRSECLTAFLFLLVVCLEGSPIICFFIIKLENSSILLPHYFYILMCISMLCIPTKFSLARIGASIFLIGNYFVSVLYDYYLNDSNLSIRTTSIIQFNLISILVNLLTTIFFIIDFFSFRKFGNGHHLFNNPILTTLIPHINYTDSNQ